MKELLFNLIKFKTISSNLGAINDSMFFLRDYFNELPLYIKQYESNGKNSLVVTTRPTKHPKVMLSGHLDVVPGHEEDFTPIEKDGKVFARGASDMKGANSAMIIALKELVEEGADVDVGLMLTPDEEVSGYDGTKYLLNTQKYSADVAFVPDSGWDWNICTDEKGVVWFYLKFKGKSAHGARLWQGENAINQAWKTYRFVRDEFRNKWGKISEEENWKPTVNLGYLCGGDATNRVPENAEMRLDVRFPGEVDKAIVMEVMKRGIELFNPEVTTPIDEAPNHTNRDSSYLLAWKNLVEKEVKTEVSFTKQHGGSDARFFSAKKIPVLMSLPVCSQPHIDDEWIDFVSLIQFKDILKRWIQEVHA